MKNTLCLLSAALLVLCACTENIDLEDRYTYKEETISSYLEKHEQFSEYVAMLQKLNVSKYTQSTLYQLLSARGHYTVFAPDNDAIASYLQEQVEKGIISAPSWDAFPDQHTLDSIQHVIVFNSIIDSGDESVAYQTATFPTARGGEFPEANMNDRKLTSQHGLVYPDSIYINTYCRMDLENRDIQASNGYIHQMHDVIAPSNASMADILNGFADSGQGNFSVMANLIRACGLSDTLSKIRDEVYEDLYQTKAITDLPVHWSEGNPGYLPEHRKYGFTLFAETDDFWRQALGKEPKDVTIADIRQYIQEHNLCPGASDDENYTNENNALNQFVTYHLLPMRIPKEKLVIHYNEIGYDHVTKSGNSIPVWEIYTTMGKRRLIKIYEATETHGTIYLNRFPNLNDSRQGDYHENSCDPDKEGIAIEMPENLDEYSFINGIIYPINRVLAYDNETRNNFQKQRLRFDAAGLFPEFMNNDIRVDRLGTSKTKHVGIPSTNTYPYLQDIEIGDDSQFYYLSGYNDGWNNYQGDEMNVIGNYEMTLRLPPVPRRGTYEIRYLVGAGVYYRSMCQVYFGTDPDNLVAQGIPLDFRMGGEIRWGSTSSQRYPSIVGWLEDEEDDDYNAEVDKKMRANGYMKAPASYIVNVPRTGPARGCSYTVRKIVTTSQMDPDQTYYLKFKSVLDNKRLQFYMDYIEYCPKEIYDNPMTPEDIW